MVEEQDRKVKQLSDLSSYLSGRFKDLNEEYNQIQQEKKGLMALKDNLETLVEKTKREGEDKVGELSIVDKEIREELEAKMKESEGIYAEIARLKGRIESYGREEALIREEIEKLQGGFASKADEAKLSREELMRVGDELERKKLETTKFMQELIENKRYLDEIKELSASLESKRERLKQVDALSETSHGCDKLVELEHISEANTLLEQEILSLDSKIRQDESSLLSEISKLKGPRVDVGERGLEQALAELEGELVESKLEKVSIMEGSDRGEANEDEILNQISRIRGLLSEDEEGDSFTNQERALIRKRRGRLRRSKASNVQAMEQVLIQSLRLIQRIDQSRTELTSDVPEFKPAEQTSYCDLRAEGADNLGAKSLGSPRSGVSGFGKRVMISNRRLLTPRKVSRNTFAQTNDSKSNITNNSRVYLHLFHNTVVTEGPDVEMTTRSLDLTYSPQSEGELAFWEPVGTLERVLEIAGNTFVSSRHALLALLPVGRAHLSVGFGELNCVDNTQGLLYGPTQRQVVDHFGADNTLLVDDEEASEGDSVFEEDAIALADSMG